MNTPDKKASPEWPIARRNIFYAPLVWLLIAFMPACSDPFSNRVEYNEGSGVFICNEGNLTYGNASLSFFDPVIESINNQVFYNTNEFPVGDVLQSMTIIDSLGYLVVNNSGKIFVINTRTFKYEATVAGLTSPRYMLPVSEHLAYVSDLYSKYITLIDPQSFKIIGTVFVGNSTEQMIYYNGFVYATSWSFNNKIYKINTATNKLSDSLEIAMQPNSIVLDKNNMIWVLSDGGFPGMYRAEAPVLSCIDPIDFAVKKELVFSDILSSPIELNLSSGKDSLYYLNRTEGEGISNGIFKFSIYNDILPTEPLVDARNRLFYGLASDPLNGVIYVSDAIDHIQKGWIFRFSAGGTMIDSFKVDIIPGAFCFKQ